MYTGLNDDVNLNNVDQVEDFDTLSLNLPILSHNSNDDMEITSIIDNRVKV